MIEPPEQNFASVYHNKNTIVEPKSEGGLTLEKVIPTPKSNAYDGKWRNITPIH
jgi:hypothetical protein